MHREAPDPTASFPDPSGEGAGRRRFRREEIGPELSALTDGGELELVHRDRDHDLYQARRSTGGITRLVKMTDLEEPTPHAIALLRREYELLRDLDIPGVVKVKGLVKVGKGLAMVMDEGGARPLAERLTSGAMGLQDFFEVSIPLAEVIARLQVAHLVHRNLTPAHILWEPESHRLTLTGFGHAAPLSALSAGHAGPTEFQVELEGTLPYLSPEQTGRTGRTADHRTDHYALGAIFYEMLTGRPPFVGNDRLELIHAQIARRPTPLHEVKPGVPKLLSDIVLKLLAKAPEERYQAAEALAYDLREAEKYLSAEGIKAFPLGRHDVPPMLQIPDKLYGRTEELALLPQVFSRVAAGSRELLLVTGVPGIGKTALVNRIEPLVAERSGFFVSGKYDQLARGVPYSALVQALRMLVRRLLAETDDVLKGWKERIQAAIRPNGQILVDVIPELLHIIGPQPPVQALGPVESKNRFSLVFQSFLRVFARSKHPLALFLDDLQWVDASSLDLVKQLIQDADNRHMLIVGAYRDTEVSATHPLLLALSDLRESGAPVREIRLGLLDQEQIAALLEDTLGSGREKVRPSPTSCCARRPEILFS